MLYLSTRLSGACEMKISVMSSTGVEWTVEILPEYTVEKLKQMSLSHFCNPLDCIKLSDYYKLVSVSQARPLCDQSSVREEKIRDGDELLLLKRSSTFSVNANKSCEGQKQTVPDKAAIDLATANLERKNFDKPAMDVHLVPDFHTELRRILVSLVELSEKLLRHHPDIENIFKNLQSKLMEKSEPEIDEAALKKLLEMGFEEQQAIQALRENKMCPMTAMDWLLAKGCRQEKDACSETSAEDISAGATAQASADKHMNAEVSNCSTEAEQKGIVGAMLECFQEYKRKDFKPNKKAMSNLKEMGFSETAILDALRIHSNSQEAACEWLLGDRRPKPVDLQVGLDTSSAIYRSIVSNPVVQLGLCSPKTLLALLQMLENPGCASRWLNDSDTAPILSQIFRIYHAEKHSVQLVRPLVM
ncbi:ubiquitin-associated domain-containing protein 1 isoform X1 [Rhipicephalus sanguineus]|uniref:ubiquitin-associated domain-containing protein 1 isoform X1 n=1 Tax=Rhipicephalus sanguineus TaxID=34632 RepID=UPI0018955D08|nr:ubiquitin-associated domain-containing protein 1 isoform X1 [Rhipicephalus sanguineus]